MPVITGVADGPIITGTTEWAAAWWLLGPTVIDRLPTILSFLFIAAAVGAAGGQALATLVGRFAPAILPDADPDDQAQATQPVAAADPAKTVEIRQGRRRRTGTTCVAANEETVRLQLQVGDASTQVIKPLRDSTELHPVHAKAFPLPWGPHG